MEAGEEGKLLVRVLDRLLDELSDPTPTQIPGARTTLGDKAGMAGMLGPKEEALVRRVRETLARIAATLGHRATDDSLSAVSSALESVEMVLRGELIRGNFGRPRRLLPSFVFLVTLPIVEQDRALALSHRTAELIKEEGIER